jgi:hypothetical protein
LLPEIDLELFCSKGNVYPRLSFDFGKAMNSDNLTVSYVELKLATNHYKATGSFGRNSI